MIKHREVLNEIDSVLSKVNNLEIEELINLISVSNTIVTLGAGRVGMAIKGFAMRLGHLGFSAYHIGDTTVPSIGKKDLLIVASGSGETQSIYDLVKIAKNNDASIMLITGNLESRIAKLADKRLLVNAPSKTKKVDGLKSIQPMTTLNEQCIGILFDTIVLEIMKITGETHQTMWNRHSNLE
tara:strand:+ start:4185 stop:4733 length:549 start_codon:yes stop_codon:yes gene_type:complete